MEIKKINKKKDMESRYTDPAGLIWMGILKSNFFFLQFYGFEVGGDRYFLGNPNEVFKPGVVGILIGDIIELLEDLFGCPCLELSES